MESESFHELDITCLVITQIRYNVVNHGYQNLGRQGGNIVDTFINMRTFS